MKTFILIAMLRTIDEGGAIQMEFPAADECNRFGQRLETQFEAIESVPGKHPSVLWVCVEK
jgi:hypothetical protein